MTTWPSALIFIVLVAGCESTPKERVIRPNHAHSFDTAGHQFLGREIAIEQVRSALADQQEMSPSDTLISDASVAIAMVEPLLFKIYGRQQIVSERPYETYLIDGYWYLSGTIPEGWNGGGFEIIMSAKNGKIIRLTHYK
ncbi:MAG: NTF2 fold immunity protein [Chitinophagaceae bacterium]